MKTVLKVILGLLAASFVISVLIAVSATATGAVFGFFGTVVGLVGSLIGVGFKLLGFVLRLLFNPVVLIIAVIFLVSDRRRKHNQN